MNSTRSRENLLSQKYDSKIISFFNTSLMRVFFLFTC